MKFLHPCATPGCGAMVPMAFLFCLGCLEARGHQPVEPFAVAHIPNPPAPEAETTGTRTAEGVGGAAPRILSDTFGEPLGGYRRADERAFLADLPDTPVAGKALAERGWMVPQ